MFCNHNGFSDAGDKNTDMSTEDHFEVVHQCEFCQTFIVVNVKEGKNCFAYRCHCHAEVHIGGKTFLW
jgi:hypothetical protein